MLKGLCVCVGFTIIYGIVELARMFGTTKLSRFEILLLLDNGLGKCMFSYKTPRALSDDIARKCTLPSQAVDGTFKNANRKD